MSLNSRAVAIYDDSSSSVAAAVKASGTSPSTTDAALVVTTSPNSIQPSQNGSSTIAALNATVVIPAGNAVEFAVSGTWVGTLNIQATNGDGTWVTLPSLSSTTSTFVTSTTANTILQANAAGFTQVRIIATPWTSGTANISWSVTTGARVMLAYSPAAALLNATVNLQDGSGNPLTSYDLDNTGGTAYVLGVSVRSLSNGTPIECGNLSNPFRVDPTGTTPQPVYDQGANRATYSIGLAAFASAATNQDVFCLIGSATKVVRLTRISFSMTATTAVSIPVQLLKRSTLNTGGTSGIAVITPHDSNDPAATATNIAYVTNQTTNGTVVGTPIRSSKYFAEVATPTSPCQVLDWSFGDGGAKSPILRSATQMLCINLGGVTIAGGSVSVSIEWTEDTN